MIDALLVFSICTFDNKHLFMMKLYQSNKNVYVQKEKRLKGDEISFIKFILERKYDELNMQQQKN